jgi:hypothetical protein
MPPIPSPQKKGLACYFFAAQGFAVHGLAAQGLPELFALFLLAFLPLSWALAAHGFFAAQGFCTAQGFLAAQGFAWAKPKLGVDKKAVATRAKIKRTDFFLIKTSFFSANCGLDAVKTELGQ